MKRFRFANSGRLRRGGVVVQVATMSTVILGMGALAIDIGSMYTVRTELQAAADSAALAAAGRLMGDDAGMSPEALARQVAQDYAARHQAAGHAIALSNSDVQLGRAVLNEQTGRWEFGPSDGGFDTVKVRAQLTGDSANGALPMTFANIFGVSHKEIWAEASAMLIPRDIAVVIDLSGSMTYDSETRYADRDDGGFSNARDIWAALDGPEPQRPYIPGSELETEYAADSGPTYGYMTDWGNPLLPGSYSASSDPGLVYIAKGQTTNNASIDAKLVAAGYNTAERNALMQRVGTGNDSNSSRWRNRVGVLMGLATWKSGKSGSVMGAGGDGDNYVEDGETVWSARPSYAANWQWRDYINFVGSASLYTSGPSFNRSFRYRYGLKSYVDFLLDERRSAHETNNLWATPEQPLRAVKDAVQVLADTITGLDSPDAMSLETFGTTSRHEVNLTESVHSVPTVLYERQAGHWNDTTNIGSGIMEAVQELESPRARGTARKVIVLMSDGVPNVNEWGGSSTEGGRDWARAAAEEAADRNITIYAVSVGYGADRPLMQDIAAITHGQEFFAGGNPEEYTEQLEDIFRSLGGKRPVALIE